MSSPLPGFTSHFGINNIPYGVGSSQAHPVLACVTRFEDTVVFLDELGDLLGNISDLPKDVFRQSSLNEFAALPRSTLRAVRQRFKISFGKTCRFLVCLVPNAAEAMTGKRSAPPAFFHMPVGYAGRCSSFDVSGTPVERPIGQYWEGKPGESGVIFGPCKKMDFELELGLIVGRPLPRRQRVTASRADEHIFGYVLVNDWSARDIQALEMIPLGPLNGKNAGTTISPWVVTADALNAFRTASPPRTHTEVPYLADSGHDALNIALEVQVSSSGTVPAKGQVCCKSNSSWLYWTLGQCLAHQAIGGCGLRTGDLLATGTVSGQGAEEHGCLLEHMRVGERPPRSYLEDEETVMLSGYCGDGVGFGECIATLMPAKELAT